MDMLDLKVISQFERPPLSVEVEQYLHSAAV
jgi:hypothetical protein